MINFKVKKGNKFFCGRRKNVFSKKTFEFNALAFFWDNCKYRLMDNNDQINKLFGHSFNFFPFYDKKTKSWKSGHHKNSVRFGWRCTDGDMIEIIAYVYINGVRKEKKMMAIDTEEWVYLNFQETESYYIFKVIDSCGGSSIVKFVKEGTKKGFLGLFIYKLFPYFGGRISSPHNMTITLKY